MTPNMVILSVILLVGAWFLLGDKSSFGEKLTILLALLFVYAVYRLMNGATIPELLSPFTNGIKINF